jgi:hypothetical protein
MTEFGEPSRSFDDSPERMEGVGKSVSLKLLTRGYPAKEGFVFMCLRNIDAAASGIGLSMLGSPARHSWQRLRAVARYLVAVDARARRRRRPANLPGWVRADVVLPPLPKVEQGLPDLFVRASLLGRR